MQRQLEAKVQNFSGCGKVKIWGYGCLLVSPLTAHRPGPMEATSGPLRFTSSTENIIFITRPGPNHTSCALELLMQTAFWDLTLTLEPLSCNKTTWESSMLPTSNKTINTIWFIKLTVMPSENLPKFMPSNCHPMGWKLSDQGSSCSKTPFLLKEESSKPHGSSTKMDFITCFTAVVVTRINVTL